MPDVAVERHLAVDLELVHVDVFAEELHDRLDHARMARELGEGIAVRCAAKLVRTTSPVFSRTFSGRRCAYKDGIRP